MASVVKKNPAPEKKPQLNAKEKKEARKNADAEALCWAQEPDRKRMEDGKEVTLHQYLTTPLHKKWGLEVKHLKDGLTAEQMGNSHKDKRLSEPCKEKTGNTRIKFCGNCRRKVRKFQLKINNETLAKRQAKGEAGHHKQYRGKPTEAALKLKKLGEDPDKRIKQGEPLPKTLAEKLANVELGEKNPAKAAAKKPQEKKGPASKAAKEAVASMRKAMKKGSGKPESKVKQGPISKPKKNKGNVDQAKLPGMDAAQLDPALMAAASQVPAAQVAPPA